MGGVDRPRGKKSLWWEESLGARISCLRLTEKRLVSRLHLRGAMECGNIEKTSSAERESQKEYRPLCTCCIGGKRGGGCWVDFDVGGVGVGGRWRFNKGRGSRGRKTKLPRSLVILNRRT